MNLQEEEEEEDYNNDKACTFIVGWVPAVPVCKRVICAVNPVEF